MTAQLDVFDIQRAFQRTRTRALHSDDVVSPLRVDSSPTRPLSPICREHRTETSAYEEDELVVASFESGEASERTPRARSPVSEVNGPNVSVVNSAASLASTSPDRLGAGSGYDSDQSTTPSDQVVSPLIPIINPINCGSIGILEPLTHPLNHFAVVSAPTPETGPQQPEYYAVDLSSNDVIEMLFEQEEYSDAEESCSIPTESFPLQTEGYDGDVSSACESSPERRRSLKRPSSPQAKAASFEKCLRSNGSRVDMYRANSAEKRFLRVMSEKGREKDMLNVL